jgi:diphosphomevalonate decarboxylase
LQEARVQDAPRRIVRCRQAILNRDFEALAEVVEADSNLMHAVMMTSSPPLFYWQPATLRVMAAVRSWRSEGLEVCYTIDAGPNVHVICPSEQAPLVQARLANLEGVEQVIVAQVGPGARLAGDENE